MPSSLLGLPAELIIQIICHLPYTSVLACAATNRLLHTLIGTSTKLQYHLTAQIAGVHSSPSSSRDGRSLSLSSRLTSLQQRESAWGTLSFTGTTEIPVTFSPSGMYALSAGVYVLGESPHAVGDIAPWGTRWPTTAIRYVRLPSAPTATDSEDLRWTRIDAQGDDILDVALNVPEWDLIAILSRPSRGAAGHEAPGSVNRGLRVHIVQLSTGAPHPSASHPIIDLNVDHDDLGFGSYVQLDVVGHRLVVLSVAYQPSLVESIYVFDWMSGMLYGRLNSAEKTYTCFSFLTSETIVFLNVQKQSLDVFQLPPISTNGFVAPVPLRPYLRLFLPALSVTVRLVGGTCRGEPNPADSSTPTNHRDDLDPHPSRADDAIMIFNLVTEHWHPVGHQPLETELSVESFVLFVHRRALRELAHEHEPYARYHSRDEDGNAVALDAVAEVEWADWGPRRTRWFAGVDAPADWITTTCGQRYVAVPHPLWFGVDESIMHEAVTVLDFNEANVRMAGWEEEEMDWAGAFPEQEKKGKELVTQRTRVRNGVFSETVWSALPYVRTKSVVDHAYDGVLMDEGRVIGIKMDEEADVVTQIDVMHIG